MIRFTLLTQSSEFSSGELVSRPFHVVRWPVVGGWLDVPAGHRAVLTDPQGVVNVLTEGLQSLQCLPRGSHVVQLVNVRRRRLELPATIALTQDGWQATIQASLEYRVRSPQRIIQLGNPLRTLEETAVSAITSVIKTMPHDQLIGSSNHSDGNHEAITARIRRQAQAALRGSGLEVVNVFVGQPEGDERRLEIKRQSQIDEAQFDADRMALARQRELKLERQTLVVLEAETLRKKAEEEQRIRLEQARIEAKATQLVQWVREWEARLQLWPDLTRQRHEQILKAIETHGHILGKMAEMGNLETVGVSSRRRPEELGLAHLQDVMIQGLANLQDLLAQESVGLPSGSVDAKENLDKPLTVRLAGEIAELTTIEGLTWTHLEPDKNGRLHLEAHLNGVMLEITCRPGFPTTRPEIVVSANGHKRVPFLFPWSEPRSLKELILEVSHRFSTVTPSVGTSSASAA